MKSWQADLLNVAEGPGGAAAIFERVLAAARGLGFDHCVYGVRIPLPLSAPRSVVLSNYPAAWQRRYHEAGYIETDPTVLHARRSQDPLVWSEAVFDTAPVMWDEAQSFGLRHGWAKSTLNSNGVSGMLTVARSHEALGADELARQDLKLRWLVSISHQALSRELAPELTGLNRHTLTEREVEVLRWTADGKTSGEISDILSISENTVNFHVKNAVAKLQVANKTAAAVRAAMLGLLN